ncbi:hypothetical protein QOT17_012260 [Balamuthia mandrillaris]
MRFVGNYKHKLSSSPSLSALFTAYGKLFSFPPFYLALFSRFHRVPMKVNLVYKVVLEKFNQPSETRI